MEREQAQRVRAGDVAVYRRARHRVIAIHDDGFWAPYFELEGAGIVGHALIDSVEIQPAYGIMVRQRAARVRIDQAAGLLSPELGIQA